MTAKKVPVPRKPSAEQLAAAEAMALRAVLAAVIDGLSVGQRRHYSETLVGLRAANGAFWNLQQVLGAEDAAVLLPELLRIARSHHRGWAWIEDTPETEPGDDQPASYL